MRFQLHLILSLLITLLAGQALATKDLFLFVSAAKSAPQIASLDYDQNQHAKEIFRNMVIQTNANLSIHQRPLVVDLELNDLSQIAEGLNEKMKAQSIPEDSQVKMIFFTGHGNTEKFWFHSKAGYDGKSMADILTTPSLQSRLSKDVGVYFGACNCGESLKPSGFQMQFMQEFKEANAKVEESQKTRSLVSIAHRYMSASVSFSQMQGRLDTMFYKLGVLSVVENLNDFLFRTVGRAGMAGSSLIVASAFAGTILVLKTFVGPEALGGGMSFFYDHFWAVTGASMFGHGILNYWTSRWTRLMEYRNGNVSVAPDIIAAGNAVLKLIKITPPRCAGLFQ